MNPTGHNSPTVILFPEQSVYGTFYRPVNRYAKLITKLIGASVIPSDRLRVLQELGYRVEIQETQIIPFRVRP